MRWLFLFLLIPHLLFSKEQRFVYAHYPITPKVDVISGHHLEEECDLVVAGSEPLSIRRFYNHSSGYSEVHNFWHFNPEHSCVANFEWNGCDHFVTLGEANGHMTYLNKSPQGDFRFRAQGQPFIHADTTGQRHPLNRQITYKKVDMRKGDPAYRWEGAVTEGDGTKKTIQSERFDWHCPKRVLFNEDKYYPSEYEEPDTWIPYEAPVIEEKKPNGNIICYSYESHSGAGIPEFQLLKSITAYNHSKTKVLGQITLHYPRHKNGFALRGFEIEGSDGRKVNYGMSDISYRGDIYKIFSSVSTPHLPPVNYTYHPRLKKADLAKFITGVERPDGRTITTQYHPHTTRVTSQMAPVGPNGEMCPIARYDYHPNGTIVWDAEDNHNIYRYDNNGRMTAVEVYEKDRRYRTDRYEWDFVSGNLLKKNG